MMVMDISSELVRDRVLTAWVDLQSNGSNSSDGSTTQMPQWLQDGWDSVVQFCHTNPVAMAIVGIVGLALAGILLLVILSDL